MAVNQHKSPWRSLKLVTGLSLEEKQEVRAAIDEGGGPTRRYWILLILSTVIAAFGLLTNSTAVVIGAMIIAPLMGPIVASALAIDAGDNALLRKSLIAEITGVGLAVFIAFLIGKLPFQLGVSTEMLARTTPTLYDLFIGVASGLAGAYAMVDKRVSNTLAGVAISVALVPPLAACGLFLAELDGRHASGAFVLFIANFLAIQIGAGLVFFGYGIADISQLGRNLAPKRIVRFVPSLVLLFSIGVFMTATLVSIVKTKTLESKIHSILSQEIGSRTGGQLDRVLIRGETADGFDVIAVALTPQPFDAIQVKTIEDHIRLATRPDVHLIIRSLSSSDTDHGGQVFLSDAELGTITKRKEEETLLSLATSALNGHLRDVPGATLVNLLKNNSDGTTMFTAVVRTPIPIEPARVATMQATLSEALKSPVELRVRSVLTRDADADHFLYEPVKPVQQLTPKQRALRNRITQALTDRLSKVDGAALRDLVVESSGASILVRAVVEAPVLVTPAQVNQYEQDLRNYVNAGITLEVRTTVAATATSSKWTSPSQGN